jgi:hypothetical protein
MVTCTCPLRGNELFLELEMLPCRARAPGQPYESSLHPRREGEGTRAQQSARKQWVAKAAREVGEGNDALEARGA